MATSCANLINTAQVTAVHDVSDGGLGLAVIEMALAARLGASLSAADPRTGLRRGPGALCRDLRTFRGSGDLGGGRQGRHRRGPDRPCDGRRHVEHRRRALYICRSNSAPPMKAGSRPTWRGNCKEHDYGNVRHRHRALHQGSRCRMRRSRSATSRAMATTMRPMSISAAFKGKSRVQQHQMVYAALKGRMGGESHALALQTGASLPRGLTDDRHQHLDRQ